MEKYIRKAKKKDEIQTDRIYLPIKWTAYHIQSNYGQDKGRLDKLQRYINSLPRDKKYFTVVQYDDGCMVDFPFDCAVFSAGGKPDNGIPIPLVCDPLPIKQGVKKDITVSMVCSIYTHPIRREIYKQIKGIRGVYATDKRLSTKEYTDILQRSYFTIAPRGYGKTSFRLYEAFQTNTIPVYVYDELWLPLFKDIPWCLTLPWQEMALLVEHSDDDFSYKNLVDFLRKSHKEEYHLKKNFWKKETIELVSTYKGCFRIIKTYLEGK